MKQSFAAIILRYWDNPLYVNLVVFLVRPNPFDPENALFEIYRGHQPIAVGQDIENNPVR